MKQKIIAKARFVPQNKTLAEWEAENPILLIGEHGVANDGEGIKREKIGDGVTPWNELDWWKGESAYEIATKNGFKGTEAEWLTSLKGEKGEKGDTGAQGIQGVQGIQGEKGDSGEIINLDQTYNAESENAQSGVAVAQAVAQAKSSSVPRPKNENDSENVIKLIAYDNDATADGEYVKDEKFLQVYVENGNSINQNCIPMRDSNGNLWTGTPINDDDCVNKGYALEAKMSPYDYEGVYCAVPGSKTSLLLELEDNSAFELSNHYGTIPRRQSNGNLLTNEPVKELDCVNKAYVDGLVGDIETLLGGI